MSLREFFLPFPSSSLLPPRLLASSPPPLLPILPILPILPSSPPFAPGNTAVYRNIKFPASAILSHFLDALSGLRTHNSLTCMSTEWGYMPCRQGEELSSRLKGKGQSTLTSPHPRRLRRDQSEAIHGVSTEGVVTGVSSPKLTQAIVTDVFQRPFEHPTPSIGHSAGFIAVEDRESNTSASPPSTHNNSRQECAPCFCLENACKGSRPDRHVAACLSACVRTRALARFKSAHIRM